MQKKYNQNPHFLKKFSEGFPKKFYFILQEENSTLYPEKMILYFPLHFSLLLAQQFLLRNGLMKLIRYIYLKKDREMS